MDALVSNENLMWGYSKLKNGEKTVKFARINNRAI